MVRSWGLADEGSRQIDYMNDFTTASFSRPPCLPYNLIVFSLDWLSGPWDVGKPNSSSSFEWLGLFPLVFSHSNENMPGLACCKVRTTGAIVPLPYRLGWSQLNAWYMSIPGPNEPLSYAYPKSLNYGVITKINDCLFYAWVLRCLFTQHYCSNG